MLRISSMIERRIHAVPMRTRAAGGPISSIIGIIMSMGWTATAACDAGAGGIRYGVPMRPSIIYTIPSGDICNGITVTRGMCGHAMSRLCFCAGASAISSMAAHITVAIYLLGGAVSGRLIPVHGQR